MPSFDKIDVFIPNFHSKNKKVNKIFSTFNSTSIGSKYDVSAAWKYVIKIWRT